MEKKSRYIVFLIAAGTLFFPTALIADGPLPAWYTTDSVSSDYKRDLEGITDIYDNQSPGTMQQRLRESREEWERQKKVHADSYAYTRAFRSWVGFGHKTIITITGGGISERRYEAFDKHGRTTDTYTEKGGEIGKHRAGEAPMTVDELYDFCADEILIQDPRNNVLNLEISGDGLLKSCTYRSKGCVDDCSEGIGGFSFSWIE